MANEYAVNASDLTAVADAIRTKGGTSAPLAFPSGFVAAVEAIAAGTGGGAPSGLAYDMGEFVFEEDVNNAVIPHNLGAVPGYILVWTEDFEGITENPWTVHVNTGTIYVSNPWGLPQRFTSAVNAPNPVNFIAYMPTGEARNNVTVSSSVAYGLHTLPTDKEFTLSTNGNPTGYKWRAGVTYKYFVSEAPWA